MKKRLISLFIAFSMVIAATSSVMADSAAQEDNLSTESTSGQDVQSTESVADQNVQSTESTSGQDVFEAEKTGVVFTLPDDFKDIKGTIDFVDYGDDDPVGPGCIQMSVYYYPMGQEEYNGIMAEKKEAEEDYDLEALAEVYGKLNNQELFGIYGLDENRGVDDLLDLLLTNCDSLSEFYTEEEFEKIAALEKKLITSSHYNVLGTKGGYTYILKTLDPELLKTSNLFTAFGDEYYDEFISLLEKNDLIENNLELTGDVKLTVPFELAANGDRIEFEATDLDGNPVRSEDLFAGHPVTAINLWATWCGPCKGELPELETLNAELKENNCQIIGIVTDATKEKKITLAKEILADAGAGYVNLVPFEGLSEMLPLEYLPTTYFVDENGVLIGEPVEDADPDRYRETIAQLLEGEAQLSDGEALSTEGEAQLTEGEAEPSEAETQLSEGKQRMVGGWYIVPHEAEELPEDAQDAFDKATKDLDGAEYTPVALMATQVVAGTNYCILCQITPVVPDGEPTWALVYIYADLQGNAEIMNVYELYIAQHSTPKPQQ